MSQRTISEALVQRFFAFHGIRCTPVPTRPGERTPDFVIALARPVVCEVKQIDPNADDRQEIDEISRISESGPNGQRGFGRWIPNRARNVLKDTKQLQEASKNGTPTLLVIYDATPFQAYYDDTDILQGMFGQLSVKVTEYPTARCR